MESRSWCNLSHLGFSCQRHFDRCEGGPCRKRLALMDDRGRNWVALPGGYRGQHCDRRALQPVPSVRRNVRVEFRWKIRVSFRGNTIADATTDAFAPGNTVADAFAPGNTVADATTADDESNNDEHCEHSPSKLFDTSYRHRDWNERWCINSSHIDEWHRIAIGIGDAVDDVPDVDCRN
jgi:hypothetical protein